MVLDDPINVKTVLVKSQEGEILAKISYSLTLFFIPLKGGATAHRQQLSTEADQASTSEEGNLFVCS